MANSSNNIIINANNSVAKIKKEDSLEKNITLAKIIITTKQGKTTICFPRKLLT